MARPGVVDRIMEVVGTHEAVTPPGPSREELLHMVSSAKRDVNDLVSETTRCFWLRRTPALLARRNTSTSNRCC